MTMNPILAVIFMSVMLMPLSTAIAKPCTDGMYWSKAFGQCVHRPYNQVAICKDGTSSVGAWVRGACRAHGGVDHIQMKRGW